MLAAAAFLWFALAGGALATPPGCFVLAGLALCALGDVLLIPSGAGRAFLAGMGAFALGHAAYAGAALLLGISLPALTIGALLLAPVLARTWRWLAPNLPRAMRAPVAAYTAIVGAMALLTCAASANGASPWLAAGGVAFAISDLSVARERFIAPRFVNVAWGLPLYFAAQLAIGASVAIR